MKTLCFSLFLISLCVANRAAAQCSSAPPAYSAACTEMQGYLSSYNATLSSQWNGAKSSAVFGTELLAANDNIGLTGLLAPNALGSPHFPDRPKNCRCEPGPQTSISRQRPAPRTPESQCHHGDSPSRW